jgi:hypothetical protein
MKDNKKLTKTEQKLYDAINISGITPISAKQLYVALRHEVPGDSGIYEIASWISRIKKKRGPESIVNRHGFGYVTQENYQKGLERMDRMASERKE